MMYRLLIIMLGIGGFLCGGFSAHAGVMSMIEQKAAPIFPVNTLRNEVVEETVDTKAEEADDTKAEEKISAEDAEYDEIYTPEEYVEAVEGKRFQNPHMQYGESHNISKIIKDALTFEIQSVTAQDAKDPERVKFVYIMRGERAIKEMLDNGEECLAYIDDAINERVISNNDINTEDLQYKYVCESRISTVSKDPVEVCEGEDTEKVLQEYKDCILNLDIEDSEMVEKMADCRKTVDEYKSEHCQMERNVETSVECDGRRYFTVRYSDNKGIIYIPLERSDKQYKVSPDLAGLPYERVVEKLLNKYGPATYSIRRKHYGDLDHCSNLASFDDFKESGRIRRYYSDTYYWESKNWIVRCQLIFPDEVVRPLDDTPVKYVSTIYINKHTLENASKKVEENN